MSPKGRRAALQDRRKALALLELKQQQPSASSKTRVCRPRLPSWKKSGGLCRAVLRRRVPSEKDKSLVLHGLKKNEEQVVRL